MHLFICPKCKKTNQIPDSQVNLVKDGTQWIKTAKCKYCLQMVKGGDIE